MAKGGLSAAPVMSKSEDDYRAEDDHRTLTRAEEIRGDGQRMQKVRKIHRKKAREIASLGAKLRSGGKRRSSGKSR